MSWAAFQGPIDWSKKEKSKLFLHSKYPLDLQLMWQKKFNECWQQPGFIALATSGTTSSGEIKIVILSHEAFLISAEAVNHHLQSSRQDTWLHLLPDFHVGGLAIWARAWLSGAKVIHFTDWRWSISQFRQIITDYQATLISMVPTQVYDVVRAQIKAPEGLRAVVVGGGALSSDIHAEGLRLGWPLLPSYGLTECCSQVATASLGSLSEDLSVLSHVQLRIIEDSLIAIKSSSLLEGYFHVEGDRWSWIDPKVDGWLNTQDMGVLVGSSKLKIVGRKDNQIKILGELVSVSRLEKKLMSHIYQLGWSSEALLRAEPHARNGWEIVLLYSSLDYTAEQAEQLKTLFNQGLLPTEQIKKIKSVAQNVRSEMGKSSQFVFL